MTRLALALLLAAAPTGAQDWRRTATADDRARLREWRTAWVEALAQARAGGAGEAIAAEPALFDPDRALRGPSPPAGSYRCRTMKLGSKAATGPAFVAYGWFACSVASDGTFAKLDGSQRPMGRIYPQDELRAVFLGTLVLGDERRPLPHGRDRERDMAGWVERIGERRWRLVLPYPRFESLLDVVEIAPQSVGTTGGGTTPSAGA